MPPRDEFRETHVRTRRATDGGRDVIYGADFERRRFAGDDENPDWVTEEHNARVQAACGCLIGDDVRPRFHRDGALVCTAHYAWCSVCSRELLPLELVVVEKKVFCRSCGERFIDRCLWLEFRKPGSLDKLLLENLKLQKQQLRSERWKAKWNRLLGRRDLPAIR